MIIVKIGGGKSLNLSGIVRDLAELEEKFIIVHGANAARDQLAEELGKPKRVITSASGYSSVFSDETAIDILMMAYAGLKNKRLVELCLQHGINAVGLSGLDGKAIQGKRNKGIRTKESGKLKIIRDYSGKPQSVNKKLLKLLLNNNYVPVLCVPIVDENNVAINSENDDIVRVLHATFHAEKIVNLIEAPGFLEEKDNPNSLVKKISRKELLEKEQQTESRMKRKILALRELFEEGSTTVIISDGRVEHPIKEAMAGRGTIIR